MSNKNLAVIEQKEVLLYDDEVTAVRVADGHVYVPVRPICEKLGLNWPPQFQRIQRDPVLSEVSKGVIVTITPSSIDGRGGGPQEMTCLPLEFINGWLFGIQSGRVRPELREKIIAYQRNCYQVLFEAFQAGRLTYHDQIMNAESPAGRAYQVATALADLARQQWIMEQRIETTENTLVDHTQRLETVEALLGNPERFISEAQAVQISQAVLTIAHELGRRSGRNEYQGVYAELYRRFEITSYKRLPHKRFEDAIEWLRGWYATITDTSKIPF